MAQASADQEKRAAYLQSRGPRGSYLVTLPASTLGEAMLIHQLKDASKGHYQRGVWNLPEEVRDAMGLEGNCMVWFPKLYSQERWDNSLSSDGQMITEINKNWERPYKEQWDLRIVMARSRDELNRTLYRFVGVFEIIPDYSEGNERRFRRIATRVPTFRSLGHHSC